MPRFLRYAAIGAFATAVHYALLVLAVEAFGWSAPWGSGLGAVVGAQIAYAGNRRLTFAHDGPVADSWWRFQATALLGALVGMGIVAGAVRLGWHYLGGQVAATLASLLLTFTVNRLWTFR